MNKTIQFGENVTGFQVPVLNEREIRAAAGIMFFFAFLSLMLILFKNDFTLAKFVISLSSLSIFWSACLLIRGIHLPLLSGVLLLATSDRNTWVLRKNVSPGSLDLVFPVLCLDWWLCTTRGAFSQGSHVWFASSFYSSRQYSESVWGAWCILLFTRRKQNSVRVMRANPTNVKRFKESPVPNGCLFHAFCSRLCLSFKGTLRDHAY